MGPATGRLIHSTQAPKLSPLENHNENPTVCTYHPPCTGGLRAVRLRLVFIPSHLNVRMKYHDWVKLIRFRTVYPSDWDTEGS